YIHETTRGLSIMGFFLLFSFYNVIGDEVRLIDEYILPLHDALPISGARGDDDRRVTGLAVAFDAGREVVGFHCEGVVDRDRTRRSEEHTTELQSRENHVCYHILEKKKLYKGTIEKQR